jgi:hypothetical protein
MTISGCFASSSSGTKTIRIPQPEKVVSMVPNSSRVNYDRSAPVFVMDHEKRAVVVNASIHLYLWGKIIQITPFVKPDPLPMLSLTRCPC